MMESGAKRLNGLGPVGKEGWQSNSKVVLKSREGHGRKRCHGELQTAVRFRGGVSHRETWSQCND